MFNPEQKFEEIKEEAEVENAIPKIENKKETPGLKPLTQEEFERRLREAREGKSSIREQMTQAIEKAFGGSHMVKIALGPGAMSAAHQLLEMVSSKIIQINNNDQRILGDIVEYGNWRGGHPTITLTLTDNFDEKLFIRQLGNAIEKIEAID